jgi:hypothetical protein
MTEKIKLTGKEKVSHTGKGRGRGAGGEGKYVTWFKSHAGEILTLGDDEGIQLLPEELRDAGGKNIGTTTVQYNLMRLFYAAEIPFRAVTETKIDTSDGIEKTFVVIKRAGPEFNPEIFGVSHRKDTVELRKFLQNFIGTQFTVEGTSVTAESGVAAT